MTRTVFAVIGSGKQGTAQGYDLARFGLADSIVMADRDFEVARSAANRINRLVDQKVCEPVKIDGSNENEIAAMLKHHKVTTCCGAAHYALNLPLTLASIVAGANFCDMGGNTGVVHQQHRLNSLAIEKNVAVIPDCGIAPGTANVLAARAINAMKCDSVNIVCGGLPQSRDLPLGYRVVFSVQGLTNEYTGNCVEIRNGRIVEVPAFTEKEELELPSPVGRCEAFLTSGGTSTGPWSFLGKVGRYGYKTVRYNGHYDAIRTMIDMGFLSQSPVETDTGSVIPRELFHTLASRYWDYPEARDLLIMQVTAHGTDREGKSVTMVQDLIDYEDIETGFTAMERTTAYSAAIVAIQLNQGKIKPGVHPLELAIDPDVMVEELKKRDIAVSTRINS